MNIKDYETMYYADSEKGEARVRGIYNAILKALETQDIPNALELYYIFIKEDTFESDKYMSVIIFPEYLALFEKYPEYQSISSYHLMWAYKWINESVGRFYQVSWEQITNIFLNYERLCKKFHYNLKTYYRTLWNVMYNNGVGQIDGIGNVRECHEKMLQCSRDSLSEIPAGECDDEIKYLLFVENDIEKALKKAIPIFNGRLSCGQVPHYTYTNFADYYFETGDLKNAKLYADKAIRVILKDYGYSDSMIYYKGKCMLIFAYTDLQKALNILKRQYHDFSKNKSGEQCFYFYLGAYHTMKCLEKQNRKTVSMNLPHDCEIYKETGRYSVCDIKKYFYDKAALIAEKFDERNRNCFYNNMLKKEYDFEI